jgi:NitT/TauT family transport system substrate-binding protein
MVNIRAIGSLPRWRWLAAAAVLVGALAATPAALAQSVSLKLATTPPSFVESVHILAQQEGFFERNGLKVEVVQLRGDIIMLRALIAGEVQIASVGSYAIFNAVQKGAELRAFVAPVPQQPHALVAPKSITGWKDLPGKNFAISEPGAISQTFPRVIMAGLGINPDQVNYLAIGGNAARQKAVQTGTVDATLIHRERAIQMVRADPKFHVVANLVDHLPGVPLVLHTATRKWLDDNPDAARRYAKAMIEATRFALANKPAMAKLGQSLIGGDIADVEAAYDDYVKAGMWGANGELAKKDYDFTVKLGIDTGEMKEALAFDKVVDMRFVEAALKELGRVGP